MTKTLESVQARLAKVHTPESAACELEYLEYVERNGGKTCPVDKTALANIATKGDWNIT